MKAISFFDKQIILRMRKISVPGGRIALAIIFFWFGILKVIGNSPANDLVQALLEMTMPSVSFATFVVLFGIFEMCIGIAFLIPRWERVAILFLLFHMVCTALPLFLLPDIAWQSPFVPTLEGQYIIKNFAIVALAVGIAAHLHPIRKK